MSVDEVPASRADSGWKHGHAISEDGTLRFVSVSQIELAGRCLRRWLFSKKFGIKEGDTEAKLRGVERHGQNEIYLKTGERGHLPPQITKGMHLLPPPGPDLIVEQDIVPEMPDGSSGLHLAPLRCAGVPVVGKIDLGHARPENYGADDDVLDEPGVLKLVDWKFVSSMNWAKSGPELVHTFQMAGYAMWGHAVWPSLEKVRLAHGYFPLRGDARLAHALVGLEQPEATWKRAAAVVVSMVDAARETDPEKVDYNTDDCNAFNRVCPVKEAGRCGAVPHASLAARVGVTAADRLIRNLHRPAPGDNSLMTTSLVPGSLLAQIKARQEAAALAGQAGQPASVQMATTSPLLPPTPPPPTQAQIDAEVARLEAETAARAKAAADAKAAEGKHVVSLVEKLESYGLGKPALAGIAAVLYAMGRGIELGANAQIGGTGMLGSDQIDTPEALEGAIEQVAKFVAENPQAAPAPATTAPAETPVSTPTVGTPPPASSAPVEAPKRRGRPPKVTPPAAPAIVNTPAPAPAPQPQTDATVPPQAEAPVIQASIASEAPVNPAPAAKPGVVNFYIDCNVVGRSFPSFWPVLTELRARMSKDAGVVGADFRNADKTSRYGFAGWRGIADSAIKDAFAKGEIPAGDYTFEGARGDIGSSIVETLMDVALTSGGMCVWGAR